MPTEWDGRKFWLQKFRQTIGDTCNCLHNSIFSLALSQPSQTLRFLGAGALDRQGPLTSTLNQPDLTLYDFADVIYHKLLASTVAACTAITGVAPSVERWRYYREDTPGTDVTMSWPVVMPGIASGWVGVLA
jgi:hypothetical protein